MNSEIMPGTRFAYCVKCGYPAPSCQAGRRVSAVLVVALFLQVGRQVQQVYAVHVLRLSFTWGEEDLPEEFSRVGRGDQLVS